MWTLHRQQQQRGAQMHARGKPPRQPGEAPADAVVGRGAQEHDKAGDQTLQAGDYPASTLPHGDSDPATGIATGDPIAPESAVAWDEVVQPEPAGPRRAADDNPLPEGK